MHQSIRDQDVKVRRAIERLEKNVWKADTSRVRFAIDADGAAHAALGVVYLPTTVIVDPEGCISPFKTIEELRRFLETK